MRIESLMTTENEVIDSISSKLEEMGYEIKSKCSTSERGIDLHAIKNEVELLIEAKGGTTSKDTSRKGKPFNCSQVKDHVAMAILKAMQLKQKHPKSKICIALPSDEKHKRVIETVMLSLKSLDVTVIWSDGQDVTIDQNQDNPIN